MGADPWTYYVPFEPSVADALEKLRRRVFADGEYRGAEWNPATPEAALEESGDEGTASILDILSVSDSIAICAVCPLPERRLIELLGTSRPTHEMVAANRGYFADLDRGQAVYITIYKDGKPHEYLFAGYSVD